MFKKNMVCSLKSDGKFLREDGDSVRLPFRSEYLIYMKNLETRKAVVKITIDGKDVLGGNRLIVNPESVLELEGFMDGTMALNKFKFIEMTRKIEDHRGITPEDGLIRIEFDYEEEQRTSPVYYSKVYVPSWWEYQRTHPVPYTITWADTYSTGTLNGGGTISSSTYNSSGTPTISSCFCSDSQPNDNGITVKGSDIYQQFGIGYTRDLEGKPSVMTFKLFGYDETQEQKPIFTNDKIPCSICGTKNKSFHKYCAICGTRLGT